MWPDFLLFIFLWGGSSVAYDALTQSWGEEQFETVCRARWCVAGVQQGAADLAVTFQDTILQRTDLLSAVTQSPPREAGPISLQLTTAAGPVRNALCPVNM